jgi:TetR/AcrR family transcriptional regulator
MARIREKQLQKRKLETLDVALRLLMERGYANLNMDELADEVGISKPTLYQYFKSKDELVAQAMVRMFEKMEEQLTELSEKSPLEQLEHYLRLMLKSRSEKRNIMAQLDVEIMHSIIHRYPYMTEHLLATRAKLGQIVRKAQEQGEIQPALPAWVVVNALFSMQGIINNPFTKEDPQRSDEELAEAIESIVHLFKQGVCSEMPLMTSILR